MEFIEELLNMLEKLRLTIGTAVLPDKAGDVQRVLQEAKTAAIHLQQQQMELRKSKEDAALTNKLKSEFLTNMSYALRDPLGIIMGYAEILQEKTEKAGLKDYGAPLAKIMDSAKYLLELSNDVLDLSKIESGNIEIVLEDVKLDSLAKELTSTMEILIEKNNNKFKINIDSEFNVMYSDAMRVRQSLLNVLSNANKFTENGKITLSITSFMQNKEGMIQFTIADTGVGMTEEQLDQLFQSFAQHDFTTTRMQQGGTGLGLYLSKRFCELLGGGITVKSKAGKGSVFTLTLPLKSRAENPQMKSAEKISMTPSHGKTILFISSDIDAYTGEIKYTMEKSGFSGLYTSEAVEGLKLARVHKPQVIVLDIFGTITLDNLLMDEWAVLSELKSDLSLSKIPVIVIRQNSEEGFGTEFKDIDFLSKPVDVGLFVDKIKRLLPKKTPTLLVADDDAKVREIMCHAIREAGWKSIEAENGQEALEKIKTYEPSLILLDLMMPEMDGLQVINEMQKNERLRKIPVIVASAKKLSSEEHTMLAKYTKGILQKGNYSHKELMDAISNQIN